jgi:hypothetical protein
LPIDVKNNVWLSADSFGPAKNFDVLETIVRMLPVVRSTRRISFAEATLDWKRSV